MKAALACLPLLLLAACDALPRDPAGSSVRIRATKMLRVGVAQGEPDFGRAASARLLGRLARETGARPRLSAGSTEPLLMALERGDLDLVLTPLDPESPWMTRVSLSPPLAARGMDERRVTYHAVMRNGENRWIMTVEKAARRAADAGVEP
jgi:hypothetical protein